ncbi:unnamed protein product [Spirodela intermedia]|uniref:GPI inositol-deacylase n=1 Tax=Spirodela intermedia TaxID=51605 RepID=A0A7I8IUM2_SPIIN|nr:unnamed protein product [Spirodela intermedia]CAA6661528.1 unnamed protein product [Spirodela intermedia]
MQGCRARCRVGFLVVFSLWMGLVALYGLLKPAPSSCVMTYMYPTYIPISTAANISAGKYGLFLYHEGWKAIDFNEHLQNLNGVPVLFIPGNGGSYKQVRSLAAESSRAFQGGPLEPSYYKEASLTISGERSNALEGQDELSFPSSSQYTRKLDWFSVDLEEEHSALDGQILEEQTEYVVYAVHRILDQYKESMEARSKRGEVLQNLPTSVILVGHSMGGFVARAVVVHPQLRKSSVETLVTLSSPHQSPPVALQPSLGQLFSEVNSEWRKGYEIQTTRAGHFLSGPKLSHVLVISIAGGVYDHQIRTELTSLEGIVPPTHGFMIGTSSVKNVWLSVDHQSILWCNQLVIQISHTLLSLINPGNGRPFPGSQKRLAIFTKMLQSGVSQSFHRTGDLQPSLLENGALIKNARDPAGSQLMAHTSCPPPVHWPDDGLEKDLYVQSRTVTVLAMDGRRRWLDINKLILNCLGIKRSSHFILVTNLAPCYGIRLHLWPEKNRTSEMVFPETKSIVEVTSRMVHIPAGPAPRQIEPGSQTEQAPPSAFIQLDPEDMRGYRFLTISVAPRPTVSGRPPPAPAGRQWHEDHPLPFNLSFSLSLGLLPVTLSVGTVGCGIKASTLHIEKQAGDVEHSSLCKLRCFPPVALAWDAMSGVHIVPNLYSEIIQVDSSPAKWGSNAESDKTTLLLLIMRALKGNPDAILAFVAIVLVTFVHPSVGLIFLLLVHAYNCHAALCSERKEVFDSTNRDPKPQYGDVFNQILPLDENHSTSSASGKSFADTQLELFNYRHGLLILHLLAAVMFGPSLVAWLQTRRMGHSFLGLLDSVLSAGVVLHGICGWKPDISSLKFHLPGIPYQDIGLNVLYLLCGYYCCIYALASAPYRAIHAMAAMGAISLVSKVIDRSRERGDNRFSRSRKHAHKHK